ncbi:MAG TPA: adenosylcobalamin-dependent ribonucleoside-diphosphate reductase [Blastocatellia bacterium]|nr:adenosylcobalamin-dependent ribonucleoside-diphosphate reductase [Blastocatellia bacterium]
MQLSENAVRVLEARYLRRNDRGETLETPDELFRRVARAISEAELVYGPSSEASRWEERFYELLSALDFLPNSPTLMNAGTPLGQLSACFVLPIEDSMESIFGTLRDAALIQRTGGGTGFSFSRLRPAGDFIGSTGGTSSGPVSFMRIYDCVTDNIKQGGKRRGANMAVLRCDHPDVEEFINAKRGGVSLRNFNVSVGATDEFMRAASANGACQLRHPSDGRTVRSLSARALFSAICEAAWESGDPGLLFIDAIERDNPTPLAGRIESTNPCGEVPLLPYEACNLGSVNLSHFVRSGKSDGENEATIDWERLAGVVRAATRFLDDVISVNRFPVDAIAEATLANRKAGLGVMGFAEFCILLGVSYASEAALALASNVMSFIAREASAMSERLAEKRGVFPNWERSIFREQGLRVRNATRTSIAPTGTISIIADTSSSIEPLFALAYRRRNVLGEQTLTEFNPLLQRYLERNHLDSSELLDSILRRGRLPKEEGVPKNLRDLFITAIEIAPEQHVRVQAAFQRHVDNAVSKTVNLPGSATPEDIGRVYTLAHELGCKGVTVFRYGSKSDRVLELGVGEAAYEREHFTKCDPGACRL